MPKVENARKKKDQETSTMIQTKINDTPKVSKELVSNYLYFNIHTKSLSLEYINCSFYFCYCGMILGQFQNVNMF